ncbi:MAG: hypothetical protein FWE64_01970, partial [Alphaproteobacteria bacterium]|nr:hypothetical protein [Alphaproteobacteria bacterium]
LTQTQINNLIRDYMTANPGLTEAQVRQWISQNPGLTEAQVLALIQANRLSDNDVRQIVTNAGFVNQSNINSLINTQVNQQLNQMNLATKTDLDALRTQLGNLEAEVALRGR